MTQKKYYELIKDLEKEGKYILNDEDPNKFVQAFISKLRASFKVNITFDSTIHNTIVKRLEEQFRHYYYEQPFIKTLDFLKRLNEALAAQKFISNRHTANISQKIQAYEQDPCYKYYGFLCYLRDASDKENFRSDFLFKFMDMKDEEEYQDWEDEDYQHAYKTFWTKLLFEMKPDIKLVTYLYSCFCKFEDSRQMLPRQIIEKITSLIGETVGKTEIQVELNKELKALAVRNYYQNSSQAKERINKEYDLIENILMKFSGTKKIQQLGLEIRVAKFGSLISGFASQDTDLDITILTNCYVNQNNFLFYLLEFLKVEFSQHDKKTGRTTKVQKIDASTPLIQVEIQEMRRQAKFKIDILVNNLLGVINSKFQLVYSQIPWIKQMGILFKLWAKSNGVIGKELMSSYAMILLMLHFLLKKGYVNLIYNARKRTSDTAKYHFKRQKNNTQKPDEFEVYYQFDTAQAKVTSLASVNLFEMMKELFLFYSLEGEHWSLKQGKNIISVDGTFDKDFDNDCIFTIKDPFDKPHNPGRAKVINKNFILDRFRDGINAFRALERKSKKDDRADLLSSIFEKS